jgi:hypothetical protein
MNLFLNTILPAIFSAIIGIIAYLLTKKIDENSKVKEEVRDIQRKRYEEFIDEMEDTLQIGLEAVRDPLKKEVVQKLIHQKLNKLTGKMFISAPDEIIKKININFLGQFNAQKRQAIYYEMRKEILGKTKLNESDLLWWSKNGKYE